MLTKVNTMSKSQDFNKLYNVIMENTNTEPLFALLQSGSNPNVIDDYGRTLLSMVAALGGYRADSIIPLLQFGANPNDGSLHELLITTQYNSCYQIIEQMLTEYKANPNLINPKNQSTPLVSLFENSTPEDKYTELLLKHGADLTIKNTQNYTVFAQIFQKLLERAEYTQIPKILKSFLPYIDSHMVNDTIIHSVNLFTEVLAAKIEPNNEKKPELIKELIELKGSNGQCLFTINKMHIKNIFSGDQKEIDYYTSLVEAHNAFDIHGIDYYKTNTVITMNGFDCPEDGKIMIKQSQLSSIFISEDSEFEVQTIPGFKNAHNAISKLFSKNESIKFFSHGDGTINITEYAMRLFLQKASSAVKITPDNSALLLLQFHGSINKQGEHLISTEKGYTMKTSELFKVISTIFEKPVDIILNSCKSGRVKDLVHLLPKGSKLVQFCSDDEDVPSTSYLVDTISSFTERPEDITILDIIRTKFLYPTFGGGYSTKHVTKLPVLSISGNEIPEFTAFCEGKIELEIKDGVILDCDKIDKQLVQLFTQYWSQVVLKKETDDSLEGLVEKAIVDTEVSFGSLLGIQEEREVALQEFNEEDQIVVLGADFCIIL